VITPHPGEAARLLGVDAAEVASDRFGAVARLLGAAALPVGSAALLKGPGTLVASPGLPTSVNPTGGPTLATGGAGDVLTGVIGALLARGASPRDAAILGAWMHGDAADALAARRREGWGASDVAAALPDAWQRLVEAT
jgi:NAD(P)H-hydrate epimerase